MLLILHLRILPVGRERFGVVLKQEGTRLKRKKLLCALSVCDLIGAVYEGVHISVDLEETKSLALVRYGTPKVLPNDDVPCSPDVCVKVRLCQVRKFWVTNFQAKRRTGGRTGRRARGPTGKPGRRATEAGRRPCSSRRRSRTCRRRCERAAHAAQAKGAGAGPEARHANELGAAGEAEAAARGAACLAREWPKPRLAAACLPLLSSALPRPRSFRARSPALRARACQRTVG